MADPSFYVILNANAGTANAAGVTAEAVAELFEANGLRAVVDARSEQPLADRIADAIASPAPTVVAAGGDGTITALAAALVGGDKSLAILPLGTVNALAKDLSVPLDLAGAVAALATGEMHRIDVGEVNGRIFLHKVVIGMIPGVAAGREHIRGRYDIAAKIGFLRYFFRRIARSKRIAVVIEPSSGERRVERVQALAVASNAYDEGVGQFFSRQKLDQGTLTLYVLRHFTARDFIRLTVEMLLGRWRDDEALSVESVNAVTIDTRKDLIKVMFDGEVETMHTPLVFAIRPKALSVIVPANTATPAEAA
ncbi:MAG: diacylglycerol kinase [Alphaproteobacteria bacterium]|nr:diacylglycerol kinase [Alphaproteobacteria bacterium]MBU1563158.1 diacylglycerol kinase [Alphaproteobacteria bacterium]MBU2302090.1 diacylglycerol kinase [Alphaproteobacteria bacterium]MBU2368917.1 diacylglycerol kinase [Alphaproteobacteria bacterium]